MPIDLPEKKTVRTLRPPARQTRQSEPLSPQDTMEYSITMEVSPGPGRKAWVKMGSTSSVREGETTEQARLRVCNWVEESLDRRIEELSD